MSDEQYVQFEDLTAFARSVGKGHVANGLWRLIELYLHEPIADKRLSRTGTPQRGDERAGNRPYSGSRRGERGFAQGGARCHHRTDHQWVRTLDSRTVLRVGRLTEVAASTWPWPRSNLIAARFS